MSERVLTATFSMPCAVRRIHWTALLWLVAILSAGSMAYLGRAGWDMAVYGKAIQTVGCGGSPYADGIASQQRFYSHFSPHAVHGPLPMTFVYSPITLPLLRFLSWFPEQILEWLYACALGAGFLLQLTAGYKMATAQEQRWLVFLLPFAGFFPGLLSNQVILSGNIAYILYGLVLIAAVPGWQHNQWLWFYLAVIAASFCKAPMLTLLFFPLLVGERQWIPAAATGAFGCLLFAVQPLLWPALFREYLTAVHLQFDWNHDFGISPAGILGRWLWEMNKPYSQATIIVYCVWAALLGTLLLAVRLHVRRNPFLREMWIPVALAGTILMNPRIKPYDNAALTIPLLLIGWRSLLWLQKLVEHRKVRRDAATSATCTSLSALIALQTFFRDRKVLAPLFAGIGCFAIGNILDGIWGDWLPMELIVPLSAFGLGIWCLLHSNALLFPGASATNF